MNQEIIKDKLIDLELETANVSSLLLFITSTLDEQEDSILIDALCSVASHMEHISGEIGKLFLTA